MLSVGEDCAAPVGYIHVYYYVGVYTLWLMCHPSIRATLMFSCVYLETQHTHTHTHTHTMLSLNAYYISLPNMAHIVM